MDSVKEKYLKFTKSGKIEDYLEYSKCKKLMKEKRGNINNGIKRGDHS